MQETGNNNFAAAKRLIIRIGKTTLDFAYPNVEAGTRTEHVSYKTKNGISAAANLREAIKENAVDFGRWQRVLVLIDSPVVMVPADEYSEKDKERFYRYSVTGQENNAVLATALTRMNAVAVYSISKDLRIVLTDNFSDIKINPMCTYVWQYLYKYGQRGNAEKLFCYFHDGDVEVFSFRKNRFRFTNRFAAPNAQDATYYILAAWKQLGMNSDKDELHILFNGTEQESMARNLSRYVSRIYTVEESAEYRTNNIVQNAGMPFDMMAAMIK